MQRGSAIAVAGAVTGILIAGSVASVAVINAASSSTPTDEVPIVAASVVEPQDNQVVEPAPTVGATPLPEVVIPEPIPSASATVESDQGSTPVSASSAEVATPRASDSASAQETSSEPESSQQPESITARQARAAVTAATSGTVVSTSRTQRDGYDAFAVQIQRTDGSVVTGYVDSATAVVFDWVVDKQAPTPTPAQTYDDDYDDDRDEYDDDHDDDRDEYDDDDDDDDYDDDYDDDDREDDDD